MKRKRCAVVTTSRADWGMLDFLCGKLSLSGKFDVEVVIGGSHFNAVTGETYDQTLNGDLKRHLIKSNWDDSASAFSVAVGQMMISVAQLLQHENFDAMIILGDRLELLAFASPAVICQLPIVHIHGGEVTLGALDNKIRHAISMMSALHFVSTEKHKTRLLDFGINSSSVFNVGSLGVEIARSNQLLEESVIREFLNVKMGQRYCLVTFHPTTLALEIDKQIVNNLVALMKAESEFIWIITGVNSDPGFSFIQNRFLAASNQLPNVGYLNNLGSLRYLSALKYATVVLGNSSSAIIEAPSLKTPTVNIGVRQLGREAGESIFHANETLSQIRSCFHQALLYGRASEGYENPYERQGTADAMISHLERFLYKA